MTSLASLLRTIVVVFCLSICPATVAVLVSSVTASAAGLDDADGNPDLTPHKESGPFDLPPGAHVQRDLAYGTDPLQRLDVYLPAAPKNSPLIFMVHGGGWERGSKIMWRVVKNKAIHWVGKGYIFVSTDYRMMPQADPLTQADDVAKAIAFVQSQMRSWGGDPKRLILIGHSSGAHLVSLLDSDPAIAARQGAHPWLPAISLDSGAMDVEQIMRLRHLQLYDRIFKDDPAYWREASPTTRLNGKPVAPLLVVCSTRRFDSCPQGRALAAKAATFGGRVELLPVNLTHTHINDLLGAKSRYTDDVDTFLTSVGVT